MVGAEKEAGKPREELLNDAGRRCPADVRDARQAPQASHLQFGKNAVVIDTIAPELAEVSLEALPELPGIVTTRHAGIKERKNPPGRFMAGLAKLLECLRGDSTVPAHVSFRRLSNCGQGSAPRRQPGNSPQDPQGAAQWPRGHKTSWFARFFPQGGRGAPQVQDSGELPTYCVNGRAILVSQAGIPRKGASPAEAGRVFAKSRKTIGAETPELVGRGDRAEPLKLGVSLRNSPREVTGLLRGIVRRGVESTCPAGGPRFRWRAEGPADWGWLSRFLEP